MSLVRLMTNGIRAVSSSGVDGGFAGGRWGLLAGLAAREAERAEMALAEA